MIFQSRGNTRAQRFSVHNVSVIRNKHFSFLILICRIDFEYKKSKYIFFFIIGFAWYHFSGTRQVVNTARDALNKAKELKDKVKDKAGDPADSAASTVNYLRSATATLIPGSAPFLGKVFDQIEQISKEHGDDVKKIFDETYKDFEKLAKEGGLDPQTASKAVDILQKRVKELQELAGDVAGDVAGGAGGGDAYNKLVSENPKLKDQISEQYDKLKEVIEKAKEKKPEAQKLLKETSSELAQIFKDKGVTKDTVKEAQELLKKKAEEAKKLGEEVTKDAKGDKKNK
jgi:ABC-type transporter Mla subunit MlaD